VLGLYLLNLSALIVILRLWAQAEPRADASSWLALLLVLLYLAARIWVKLAFMASEVVFFQGELAHIDYTAAPLPVWPDSPEAEAMENLASQKPFALL
jgi:sugar phosphate isomerase/epimerase